MHYKFTGIVLDHIPYSDSSSIVKFLTRSNGLQSVVAKRLNGKRGKSIRPLLRRMNVVEVEAYRGAKQRLGVIKSVRSITISQGVPNAKKTGILMFVNEVLCRTIKEGHTGTDLFDLMIDLLATLEQSDHCSDLHLIFLMKLTKTFGVEPEIPAREVEYFDLIEGAPCMSAPLHGHFIEGRECRLFFKCLGMDLAIDAHLQIDNNERRSLLDKIIEYYSVQLDEKLELRSHKVLHTVLGEN